MVSAGTLRAARNLREQKKIYAIAVNGVSDIDEIVKIARTNYRNTIRWLKIIIKVANSKMNWRRKNWTAFAEAQIDFDKKKIILVTANDTLITCTSECPFLVGVISGAYFCSLCAFFGALIVFWNLAPAEKNNGCCFGLA